MFSNINVLYRNKQVELKLITAQEVLGLNPSMVTKKASIYMEAFLFN